ncbi:alpha/beta-hydrolase [Pholiota conissans]|uniref:Alpha/beta-hydrolase n=1 Tax=Pholiota conissans TaxID=109636 RepID=A0A9P5ZD84_9AGAR|nr:alpha/beta-hydrolase [Pholiota conissans]
MSTYTETWLAGPGSTQFYTRTYAPAPGVPTKAVVVALHGFAEHVARYTHLHPLISARGIVVFAYDQRGFGLTAQDTTGKKSKESAYGKTSWKDQMADIEWALGHAKKTYEGVPLFLLGHSMGGGEALGFATQGDGYKSTIDALSGVIATSPLIQQTTPAPKLLKWIGGKVSVVVPNKLIPAEVKAEQLSHDPAVNSAYLKDPLVKQSGSLRGINDMLTNGELLLTHGVHRWPKALPMIIIHGTDDKVTSPKASQKFHDGITADKKKIVLFEGGFHELQNEPDGVKEKLAEEIVSFVEEHIPTAALPPAVETAAAAPEDTMAETVAETLAPTAAQTETPTAESGINKAKM